jgi:predicted nucleic acid-binding Zn ribbon protein
MSKHNEHTLKSAIERLLKVYKLDVKLAENVLIGNWQTVMGKMIANHTTDIYIKNKVLYVQLDSAALRNELMLSKSKIITMMNAVTGKETIADVVLR